MRWAWYRWFDGPRCRILMESFLETNLISVNWHFPVRSMYYLSCDKPSGHLVNHVKKCTLSRKYPTFFGSKIRSVAQLGIWDFWHCLQFMCENSLTLMYVHRFPGEPKLVSGPWCIPEAACSAVQLPGGRWTHQPSHDPGHACHESPQGWFTASTPVRSPDQIENQWQEFIN